jgi:hypothetical protein
MAVIHDTESELPEHIGRLLADTRRRQQEWIRGKEGDIVLLQHPDMTIYGPFGGPARLIGDRVAQNAARAQFKGGTGQVDVVRVIESDDLVVLVLFERSIVEFEGRDEPHPWLLRVTEIYQRQGDEWQRLHRHADPLTRPRPLEETLELLAE